MTAPTEQAELFPIPDAYQPSAWQYVPNVQDVCVVVDLDAEREDA